MKNHLLGLAAIATLSMTTPLMLVENFSKNNQAASVGVTKSNGDPYNKYHWIQFSSGYRRLQNEFKHLKWHADNWGLAAIPFYGAAFYGAFVDYHNSVVDAMAKIITQNKEFLMKGLKKITVVEIIGAVGVGMFSLAYASKELHKYFYRTVRRQYEDIAYCVS